MTACPEHPDFWLISQAVLDQDGAADTGQLTADIIGRYADPDSVLYMASQRALRVRHAYPVLVQLSASWVDGFLAGMAVQHLKTQGAKPETL